MKVFELSVELFQVSETETQVVLKPADADICNYIADNRLFKIVDATDQALNNYKLEMRENLFNKFQALPNVASDLKNQFTL